MKKRLLHESPWMIVQEYTELIENKATKVVEIDIDGVIGDYWSEDEDKAVLTKETMRKELKALAELKAEKIIVNINSPGGSVAHGLTIHDLLAQHPAEIITRVTGLTASIATVVVQCGDTREISDNALLLAHRAMYGILGYFNQVELKDIVDDLEVFDNKIVNIFEKRGVDSKGLGELMNAQNGYGRWLNAEEAKGFGLVDSVFEPMQAVALVDPSTLKKMNLPDIPKNYNNMDPKKKVNSPDIDNKTLLDQIKELFAKLVPTPKDIKEGTVPEIPKEVVDQVNEFEQRLTDLEQTNTDLTTQVGTLTTDLKTRTEELATAKATITEQETKLAQAQAASTKPKGPSGQEDRTDLNQSDEEKSLDKDLQSLRGELSVVHPA